MLYTLFMFSLVAVWFALEVYLLWVNYKARFKYKLKERNPLQRWLQERIGVMTLAIALLSGFGVMWLAPYVIALTFNISYAVAFISVASGILGCVYQRYI